MCAIVTGPSPTGQWVALIDPTLCTGEREREGGREGGREGEGGGEAVTSSSYRSCHEFVLQVYDADNCDQKIIIILMCC